LGTVHTMPRGSPKHIPLTGNTRYLHLRTETHLFYTGRICGDTIIRARKADGSFPQIQDAPIYIINSLGRERTSLRRDPANKHTVNIITDGVYDTTNEPREPSGKDNLRPPLVRTTSG